MKSEDCAKTIRAAVNEIHKAVQDGFRHTRYALDVKRTVHGHTVVVTEVLTRPPNGESKVLVRLYDKYVEILDPGYGDNAWVGELVSLASAAAAFNREVAEIKRIYLVKADDVLQDLGKKLAAAGIVVGD